MMLDIEMLIRTKCNPVNVSLLVHVLNTFNNLQYSGFEDEFIERFDDTDNFDPSNIGLMLNNMLLKHSIIVLREFGIIVSSEGDVDLNILSDIMDFNILVEYMTQDQANIIVGTIENEDDVVLAYSDIISKYYGYSQSRVYVVIDSLKARYIDSLISMSNNIIDTMEFNITYKLVNVLKELKELYSYNIVGLSLFSNADEFDVDTKLSSLLDKLYDKAMSDIIDETAINIMSLIILGSDSRFARMNSYIDIVEDLIYDERYKTDLIKVVKEIDAVVDKLYIENGLVEESSDE